MATINRCVCPKSKGALAEWFVTASLARLLPIPAHLLTALNDCLDWPGAWAGSLPCWSLSSS